MTRYTVRLFFVEYGQGRTEWHPTERIGPFCVIQRGGWKTFAEAESWVTEKGIKAGYAIQPFDDGLGDES